MAIDLFLAGLSLIGRRRHPFFAYLLLHQRYLVVSYPYKPSVLFVGHMQIVQNVASDQGLHCLLAECSF